MEQQIKPIAAFDDVALEAASDLLEQFWILRDKEPEKYLQIRNRERALRTWFMEKTGMRLVVHRYFAKLEKIPVVPSPWMGIAEFLHKRDYVLFCGLLAFLEGKAVDEQFLLSGLCEDLISDYPGPESLDWVNYEHRKSLIRVLRHATNLGVLHVVEGEIEQFGAGEVEVLYEVPVTARYFMRSYHRELATMKTMEAILEAEWPEDQTIRRRNRIYRRLLLEPVMYSSGANDPDFLYLRNQRNRIREDIENNFELQFELYNNAALLSLPERRAKFHHFPDNRAISGIALQFAGLAREIREQEDIPLQYDGSISLPKSEFSRWVGICRERFSHGWSKLYREADTNLVVRDLLNLLKEWQMADQDPETGIISLLPLLARTRGEYPPDYTGEEKTND
ncbi:MAG: TIGR02678 family protein [Firmicutes bacterium]|nr:TIGR02678 family protein [Bacillota bacterium]